MKNDAQIRISERHGEILSILGQIVEKKKRSCCHGDIDVLHDDLQMEHPGDKD
jgi:hypothetical protein